VHAQHDLAVRRAFVDVVDSKAPAFAVGYFGVFRREGIAREILKALVGGSQSSHGSALIGMRLDIRA
jgi:hypothetical protein